MTGRAVQFQVDGKPAVNPEEPDYSRALGRLRGLIGDDADPEQMWYFVRPGPPVAKSRARWSRRNKRFYTPKRTVEVEDDLASRFRVTMEGETITGPVAIMAMFYRQNYQRIDADNLMKAVMDAGTGAGVWPDDSVVTAQASFIELDIERPRTLVAWCPTTSTMDRSKRFKCQRCGKEFNRAGVAAIKRPPKFCSRECRYASDRVEAVPYGSAPVS